MSSGRVLGKLAELGLVLPPVAKPVAAYTPARREGSLIFISGQLPLKDGQLLATGAMTPDRDLAEIQAAMGQCFLNAVAAAGLVCDLDDIEGVIKLSAFVACSADFYDQHLVANGASELAQKIFGQSGVHARAAVGVPALPLGATVELEVIFSS